MSYVQLKRSNSGEGTQAPIFVQGKIGLTSGTFSDNDVIWCRADGDIDINYESGDPDTGVKMFQGESACLPDGCSVTINSGEFNLF